jgi:hypothetical protein
LQRHRFIGDLLFSSLFFVESFKNQAAEYHSPQRPTACSPRQVSRLAPIRWQSQRQLGFLSPTLNHDRDLSSAFVRLMQHPLNVGERKRRLTSEQDDFVIDLQTGECRRRVILYTLDRCPLLCIKNQPD